MNNIINNWLNILSFIFSEKFISGAFVAWLITNFVKDRRKDKEIDKTKKSIQKTIDSKVKTLIKNIEKNNYLDQPSRNTIKNNSGQDNIELFEDKIEEIKENISIKIEEIQEEIEEDIDWNI